MSEAYKWLQTLPQNIREEMKSMEQVVSLYLRAKRLGGALPTKEELAAYKPNPAETRSSQEFHKSLQNLKHELDQFDFAAAPVQGHAHTNARINEQTNTQSNARTHAPAFGQSQGAAVAHATPAAPFAHRPMPSADALSTGRVPDSDPLAAVTNQAPAPSAGQYLAALKLDPRSRQILSDIRESLNLSSDIEVIRMSLVLAQKALKDKDLIK
jgi:hypothetical protein